MNRTELSLEKANPAQDDREWEDDAGRGFEAALERFSVFIRAHIRRFGLDRRGIDPEDVIQDIKLKLWKKYGREKNPVLRPSYIKRVMDSTLIDILRKIRLQGEVVRPENQETLRRAGVLREEWPEDAHFREKVKAVADTLRESRRKVVKLYLLDMTIEEIASSLNWSRAKTRNLLYRGIEDLKKSIAKKGDELGHER